MLLRPDATHRDQATNQLARIFPESTGWLQFKSHLPGKEVFANSILDPSIGIDGELALETFAKADWMNWISTTQISLYEVGTRVGLTPTVGRPLTSALADVYKNIQFTLDAYNRGAAPEELVADLLKNAGLQALQQIAGQSNMIAQTVAQVIAAAVWAADVWATHRNSELAKNVSLPPLQSEEPATDSWQVNRVFEFIRRAGSGGVVYPDGKIEAASNANYTKLFLPAYRHTMPWKIQYRGGGVAAQQGNPSKARGPRGETQFNFDPGDGSTFGFMPGTTTSLRVLQASHRFYQSVRGTPVDRYALRCRGVDKPCWQSPKSFDGTKDCRQCVTAESVWPTKGVGWAYGGAPLNATTPGENVGAFYPSMNKLLLNLLEMIVQPGPLLFTVDFVQVFDSWRTCFESFWDFIQREWTTYRGAGWRGQLSRLATLMTAYHSDAGPVLGGRDPGHPLALIQDPRSERFSVSFASSIFSEIIAPYCRDAYAMQAHYLDTLEVAYIPPGAGALYRSSGKLKSDELALKFVRSRTQLLSSPKRMSVNLRRVSDPEYRAELVKSGVKMPKTNPILDGSPGLGHQLLAPQEKPARAPRRPKVMVEPALAGINALASRAPKPARQARRLDASPPWSAGERAGVAVAIGAAAVVGVAGAVALRRRDPEADEE
ncbi:hypothetical protein PPSIR1_25186 [Plesiocystis pacifica SIR-1]|uniref:Uncharacterized protein n=1 Tax=Plesiocystis pacifica SIR-1 TaxID=391625 RepID=A6GDY5_9BACT|nr:hypothetical protein [Plesiocystis pacifica]EDM75934.1 hypothetical protein PPSIR1_25186 [Plesiocystis pacifica SIR-1]